MIHQRSRIYVHGLSWLECSSLIQHATISCWLFFFISNKPSLEAVYTKHMDPVKSAMKFTYLQFQPWLWSLIHSPKGFHLLKETFWFVVEPWSAELNALWKVNKLRIELFWWRDPFCIFKALKLIMTMLVINL